jgi:hypothetical protein
MVYFGKFMSWPVGKCPNMEGSDLFSLIGKEKKIAQLIAGHPVVYLYLQSLSPNNTYCNDLDIFNGD